MSGTVVEARECPCWQHGKSCRRGIVPAVRRSWWRALLSGQQRPVERPIEVIVGVVAVRGGEGGGDDKILSCVRSGVTPAARPLTVRAFCLMRAAETKTAASRRAARPQLCSLQYCVPPCHASFGAALFFQSGTDSPQPYSVSASIPPITIPTRGARAGMRSSPPL